MRKDMAKLIVERPRRDHGGGWARRGRSSAVTDDDGEPVRAVKAVRAPVGRVPKTKSLNENLAPLKRYLESNIDRPWDRVFSEISAHLKPTSTVQQHVRDHLDDFVAVKTRMVKGVVMTLSRWGGEHPIAQDWRPFYVHPRTGLLKRNTKRVTFVQARTAQRAAEGNAFLKRARVIDAKTQLHLFDGVWWEVKLGKQNRDASEPDVVLRAKLSTLAPEKLYARPGVRAIDKRVLNRTEKKKLGLV